MCGKYVGRAFRRVEDWPLLTGRAQFVDDLRMKDLLHVAILRSPYAHARIKRIDVSRALSAKGVVAVLTGEVVARSTEPLPAYAVKHLEPEEYAMAVGKVRYVGEPVAAVAATSPYEARDAIELIDVEYEPLEPVVDPEDAMRPGAPLVYDSFGTNVVAHYYAKWGNVDAAFKQADLVIRERIRLHRYSGTPLEPVAVIASYNDALDELTIWANVQMPGHVMMGLSQILRRPTHKIRLIVPNIGGGFGIKVRPWKPLVITSLLAMKARRPVKYVETRIEHLMAAGHTVDAVFEFEVAVKKDGTILGFRLRDINNDGASLTYAGTYASMHATLINGCYNIRNIEWDSYSVLTNTCPSTPNRGVGKPGIVYVIERMINIVARELGLDPVEVRFRNFIQPHEFPYVNPAGRVYDSGDYPRLLHRALELANYRELRALQAKLRGEGRFIGIGLAVYVHGASGTAREIEGVTVKIDPNGKVIVSTGSPDMGTGHATAIVQLIADELGVDPGDVVVVNFDSHMSPWTPYSGTHANKFSGPDVEMVLKAARELRGRLVKLAAAIMQVAPADVVIEDSVVYSRSDPGRRMRLAELTRMAYQNPGLLPEGVDATLEVTAVGSTPKALEAFVHRPEYEVGATHQLVTGHGSPTGYLTYPSSAHIAVVEVDVCTCQVRVLRYYVVHDIGRIINPLIVEGQVHGGVYHGLSYALKEGFVYDRDGQLLNPTFADYIKLSITEMPDVVIDHIETPSPRSSLGIKGIGEGETLGPLPAIVNAVEDALSPFNVRIRELPLTMDKLCKLIPNETFKVCRERESPGN